jgi:hypothetical protein
MSAPLANPRRTRLDRWPFPCRAAEPSEDGGDRGDEAPATEDDGENSAS